MPPRNCPETDGFLRFASLCFRQKRKTLRNNLVGAYARELLDERPEMGQRAEQLSVSELTDLYRAIKDARSGTPAQGPSLRDG